MEDLKDMMKSLSKPFTSKSSGAFKGQGRKLGGGPESSTSASSSGGSVGRRYPTGPAAGQRQRGNEASVSSSVPRAEPLGSPNPKSLKSEARGKSAAASSASENTSGGTDGVSTAPREGVPRQNMATGKAPSSEALGSRPRVALRPEMYEDLHSAAAITLSASPPPQSVELVLKLLRNIAADPANAKFRRMRLGNPRISEALGSMEGGVEFLQAVGFQLSEEATGGAAEGTGGSETWAILEDKSEEQLEKLKEAINILEAHLLPPSFSVVRNGGAPPSSSPAPPSEPSTPVKAPERQPRVFFPSEGGESAAARIELPDSFFVRSSAEVKMEAMARRRQLEESQVLMTRSMREKQAAALKRKYRACIIRVQFPDGVVLQGVFAPLEPVSALYEFVSQSLKVEGEEFNLVYSLLTKNPVLPSVAPPGRPIPTLEDSELVPAALVKYRPGSGIYAGLKNELLLLAQPLTSVPFVEEER